MTLNIIFYGFCLVALAGQGHKCEDTMIYTAESRIESLIKDWFPHDIEFNESCVAKGCPALKNISICPIDWEINALRSITKIISNCMTGPICGIVADPRPLRVMKLSMDQFIPGLGVDGMMTLPAGIGYVSNTSDIQLEMTSDQSQQMIMLMPNIRVHGYYQLDFCVETGFGIDVTARLPKPTYDLAMKYISFFSINHTGQNLEFKCGNPMLTVRAQLCGIDLPRAFPNIVPTFTRTAESIYESSTMATAISQFITKLYRGAAEVISRNCKSQNVAA